MAGSKLRASILMYDSGTTAATRAGPGRARILGWTALLVFGAAILMLAAPPAFGQAALEYGIIASGSGARVMRFDRLSPNNLFRNVERRTAAGRSIRGRSVAAGRAISGRSVRGAGGQSYAQQFGIQRAETRGVSIERRYITRSQTVRSRVPGYGVIERQYSGQRCESIINGVRVQRGC